MNVRTDIEFRDGKIRPTNQGDHRFDLPEFKKPEALQAGWFEGLKRDAGKLADDYALRAAERTHNAMAESWNRLEKVRGHQDPAHTQHRHLSDLSTAAQRALTQHGQAADSARQSINSRKAELHREFKQHLNYNSAHAAEIRAVLRGMDDKQRSDAINKAVVAGDGSVLAAALDAHPLLSGLNPEMQRAYERQAMDIHFTPGLQLMDALGKADEVLNNASLAMWTSIDDLSAKSVLQKHESAAVAAREARQALEA